MRERRDVGNENLGGQRNTRLRTEAQALAKGGTDRMSHIVTVQTRVHDPQAVAAACRRLGLAEPVEGTARLFGGEAAGLLVQLPDWQYPVVIDLPTGTLRYDNFSGAWGDQKRLD